MEKLNSMVDWISGYFDEIYSWPLVAGIILLAAIPAIIYAATGKNIRWLKAQVTLPAVYVMVIILHIALFMIGLTTFEFFPETFESWQPRYVNRGNILPFDIVSEAILILHLCLISMSITYGILGGVKKLTLSLLIIPCTVFLYELSTLIIIVTGCYGWGVCI